MAPAVYRYRFSPAMPLDEVEHTLLICLLAVQALHGPSARENAGHHFDRRHRSCVVDGRTHEGRDLAKLLTGFLAREFGRDAFKVEPVERERHPDEYRTLGDWVAEIDLEADLVARVLASDAAINLSTPLTFTQFDDLVGLATRKTEASR